MWVWRVWCALSVLAYAGADNARMERLYAKLERLERLNALEPEGGGGEQLEMVAELVAAAPDLQADQLEMLLADLRDAEASPYPDVDYNMHEDDYHLNDDADEAVFADEGEEVGDSPATSATANAPDEWSELDLRQAAIRHWHRVQKNAGCKEPAPRSVCVNRIHPHTARLYLPPCAILHRCTTETGCCYDLKLSCAPLPTHLRLVRLPFYVLTVGIDGTGNSETWLPFVNHTRCGCLNRTLAAAAADVERIMIEEALSGFEKESGVMASDDTTRSPHGQQSRRSGDRATTLEPPGADSTPRSCSCPRGFTADVSVADAVCTCVCSSSDCLSLARGREHFGLRDRLCMKRGECAAPRCEFGVYNRAAGRCPKRRDRNRNDRAATRVATL